MLYRSNRINVIIPVLFLVSLFVINGCALFDRFEPNTRVKAYLPSPDQQLPDLEDYEVTINILAREIGNKAGIDDYMLSFELKSKDKFDTVTASTLPQIKLSSLEISFKKDTIRVPQENIDNRDFDADPRLFRQRVYRFIKATDITLQNPPDKITVKAEFATYNVTTKEKIRSEIWSGVFNYESKLKWYNLP